MDYGEYFSKFMDMVTDSLKPKPIHKCYLCGEISDKVNHIFHRHVGGDGGTTEFPICDDKENCILRQNRANKEWQQAMGVR